MSFLSRFLDRWRTADRGSAVDHRLRTLPVGIGYKWIPVIDSDYCTGCGKCVETCPTGALDLVWDYAQLEHPARCTSEASCVHACPTGIIEMQWSPVEGRQAAGQWRDSPGPPL